jgi:hypothetical protein
MTDEELESRVRAFAMKFAQMQAELVLLQDACRGRETQREPVRETSDPSDPGLSGPSDPGLSGPSDPSDHPSVSGVPKFETGKFSSAIDHR